MPAVPWTAHVPDPIHINTISLGSSRKAPGIFQDAVTFNLTFMEFQVFYTPSLVFLLTTGSINYLKSQAIVHLVNPLSSSLFSNTTLYISLL